MDKITRAKEFMKSHNIDMWVIFTGEGKDIHSPWIVGAKCYGKHMVMVPIDGEPTIIIDEMEAPMVEKAKKIKNILIYKKSGEFRELIKETVTNIAPKPTIALNYVDNLLEEGGEAVSYLTMSDYLALKKLLPEAKFVSARELVTELRMKKDKEDIKMHRKAVEITLKAFDRALEVLRPGVTETEVAAEIDFVKMKHGASNAFNTIVASGPYAADPHHSPDPNKKIKEGELVVIDQGAKYKSYDADITWTVHVGKNPTEQYLKMYYAVKEAHDAAIKAIRPGVEGWEIDKIARDIIHKHGFTDKEFMHSTGHPVDIVVHGVGPYFTKKNSGKRATMKLVPGLIMTVEPGVYIQGVGGVRIEDDILVTEDGYQVLTKTPEDLIEL